MDQEQENLGDGIFNIPEENFKKFEAAIEKLSKKSIKLTGEPITPIVFSYHMKDIGRGQEIKVFEVLLGGPTPKLNGWTFLARIDHANKELGNIVRAIPGKTVPEQYRNGTCACEHCNINRYRRDTFVVEHEDGTVKQVGRTCLKDFLGHDNPDTIAKQAELLGYAAEAARGWQINPTGYDRRYLNLETFLTHVAAAARLFGYNTRTAAKENGRSATADVALDNIISSHHYDCFNVEDADSELAREALEWAQNLGDDNAELNEYQHNIHVLASAGVIEFRSIGYAASIVGSFAREKARALNARQLPGPKYVSQHVGAENQKISFTGTIVRQTPYGDDNQGNRIAFKDESGNDLVWFTSRRYALEDGATVTVLGTVKAHQEYRGVKQTILTRCKLEGK